MPIWKRSVPSEMHADQRAKRIVELTAMAEKSERDAKCFRTQIDGLLLQVKGADMHAEGLRREIAELVSSMQEETKLFQQPKANSMQHQHSSSPALSLLW